MNITFAVFQSDGTTVGSNGLLKLFSTGAALSCNISCTILGWRLSSPSNLILSYLLPTQMNVFLFQTLFPSTYFAFTSIFCSGILPENWYKLFIKFLRLPREASEFSEGCMIWNNFNHFLPVFPDRVLQNILIASIPISTPSYSLHKRLLFQIHQKH